VGRVRELEADQVSLLVRKARLEAQRDERDNFVMPLFVGLNARNVDFDRVYSAETDIFLRFEETYREQLEALQKQQPRIEAEIKAVTEQIANQNERLEIVNGRIADLEPLFRKGFLRKEVLLNQQIETVITVCSSADEVCPNFPGQVHRYYWPFRDPGHARGTEAQRLDEYRRVRDKIRAQFELYVAQRRKRLPASSETQPEAQAA
jgi:hypothetical protein